MDETVYTELGLKRYIQGGPNHGESLLKSFGLSGRGVSFECNNCHQVVSHKLPVRTGMSVARWFCSIPCAWMDNRETGYVRRWYNTASEATKKGKIGRMAAEYLAARSGPKVSLYKDDTRPFAQVLAIWQGLCDTYTVTPNDVWENKCEEWGIKKGEAIQYVELFVRECLIQLEGLIDSNEAN